MTSEKTVPWARRTAGQRDTQYTGLYTKPYPSLPCAYCPMWLLLLSLLLLLPTTKAIPNRGYPPHWMHLASSRDGNTLIAAAWEDGVHLSIDGGATWKRQLITGKDCCKFGCQFASVAISADGQRYVAAEWKGGIPWYNNIDGTWKQGTYDSPFVLPAVEWQQSMASSEDFTRIIAITANAGIYMSTNYGVSWTKTSAPSASYKSVACDAICTNIVAVGMGVSSRSTDSGATWKGLGLPNSATSITSSADGQYLQAVLQDGRLQSSSNGGVSWVTTVIPVKGWFRIASSRDGKIIVAVTWDDNDVPDSNGEAFISQDFGNTWVSRSIPGWTNCLAMSYDGMRVVAGEVGRPYQLDISSNGGLDWRPVYVAGVVCP